ncbi:hypothetical protein, partial [Enterococcus faecalis]|uniref:hypothetical protein n=1 Tax=Enterococcus faecalis TaxID=1351 RepID=UPI003CC6716F
LQVGGSGVGGECQSGHRGGQSFERRDHVQIQQALGSAHSIVALNVTKNAMIGHSLFLKSGKSWTDSRQCECL